MHVGAVFPFVLGNAQVGCSARLVAQIGRSSGMFKLSLTQAEDLISDKGLLANLVHVPWALLFTLDPLRQSFARVPVVKWGGFRIS